MTLVSFWYNLNTPDSKKTQFKTPLKRPSVAAKTALEVTITVFPQCLAFALSIGVGYTPSKMKIFAIAIEHLNGHSDRGKRGGLDSKK